ncbi:[glutamate--ammonia-ligase] adenylyltransferase [Syntrophobacter fumaroxidans]|uniref:(Glutamate--ammonia-ligase) adenylyltransferase n=1 Tax=Syntrophobacter fumaroxidans (strain DSM 10017 / MPOB) TaxID=335543 RepID=A0LE63_SYNFM|nr:[glutamate--ammonia-ligase] adenylyltransferase [Syntrophobacter fumaroxidans]ABK15715.1 (Glutamate--ammonia-ligase) adenylyltransferase [Syntrophobacter fumaroxidans MPOB]
MDEFERIRQSSQYLTILLRTRPDFADWLRLRKHLYRRYPLTGLYSDLRQTTRDAHSFVELAERFREFKQRHFLRIGGRDLLGLSDLAETTSQLSDLAGVSLQVGLEVLSDHPEWWAGAGEVERWPEVREAYETVVMGLGKLGGQELNYVSDVDLIFLSHPRNGDPIPSHAASMLLDRLCHWLSRLMGDRVKGDRVFVVDVRLRPQGKDGLLIPSLDAAAEHYLLHGRPWERQMLLKARPVAGGRSSGMSFLQQIRPFVFRRFLDFQALDELRSMRDRILAEALQLGKGARQYNVKLGIGGIREIEFLVQSLQLIYGGRYPELDEPNTLRCLQVLNELSLLPAQTVEELREAYVFLRRVEHWVQLDQNRQTQKLPQSEEAMARLASALGLGGSEKAFNDKLRTCAEIVHGHFMGLFHAPAGDTAPAGRNADERDARHEAEDDGSGPVNGDSMHRLLGMLQDFPPGVRQTVLDVVKRYPLVRSRELSEKVLLRTERYFSQVSRRPGLKQIFNASGPWLQGLCEGIARTEMLADLLAHHPGLAEGIALGEERCPDSKSWAEAASRLLETVTGYEEGLEWIRRLKNERTVTLALADLRGDFGPAALERQLSDLADFVARYTYEHIKASLGLAPDLPLAVLGLGRLGSREMSYLSDMDLVFVYQPRPGELEDQVPGDVVRLIQRFMRMLSTPLQDGPGYAVDARLRPTGSYGPLIVTQNSWLEYYSEQADLWELQALLRLRQIAGDRQLGLWLEDKALEICYRENRPEDVWRRLCHLRGRMQRERSDEKADRLDLKLGAGGLVDLEFLIQGNLLVKGYDNPLIRVRSVRAAIQDFLEEITESAGHSREIRAAFEAIRALDHRLRLHLNQSGAKITPEQFEGLKGLGLWPPAHVGTTIETWEDILKYRRIIRAALQEFCPDL